MYALLFWVFDCCILIEIGVLLDGLLVWFILLGEIEIVFFLVFAGLRPVFLLYCLLLPFGYNFVGRVMEFLLG